MITQPQTLYHYTSLDTLALILTNKSICFNTLLNVDDVEEAETSDLGLFGKYVYVSCWTDEAAESLAMWQMYTPNMHGVRIQLPAFPFKKHYYKKGELNFTRDTTSYINMKKLYDENKACIVPELPKLIPITYTIDKELLRPIVRSGDPIDDYSDVLNRESTGNQSCNIQYDLNNLGRFKNEVWRFQKEWRYWISMAPWGIKEMEGATASTQVELLKRLEDEKTKPPYERFFVELSDDAVSQMEIVFGPRMTEAEKILAKHLLRDCGLDGKCRDSALRVR
ncbi:MAG: DUF2971 domain-containing protein [Faecousia sp.]